MIDQGKQSDSLRLQNILELGTPLIHRVIARNVEIPRATPSFAEESFNHISAESSSLGPFQITGLQSRA
jgi:hypothetical protein